MKFQILLLTKMIKEDCYLGKQLDLEREREKERKKERKKERNKERKKERKKEEDKGQDKNDRCRANILSQRKLQRNYNNV